MDSVICCHLFSCQTFFSSKGNTSLVLLKFCQSHYSCYHCVFVSHKHRALHIIRGYIHNECIFKNTGVTNMQEGRGTAVCAIWQGLITRDTFVCCSRVCAVWAMLYYQSFLAVYENVLIKNVKK